MAMIVAGCLYLTVTSVFAETYRWKDKDGKVHYGASVPAEYADLPYDILNNAGMVIEHVEDTSTPMEERAEQTVKKREPLISGEERQRATDRLLVIQYRTEEEIDKALLLEIAQLGYDKMIINQSYKSTKKAIREQIKQAADQERAGRVISEDQNKDINRLYARLSRDEKKQMTMHEREERIRTRFKADLDRYRFLTSGSEETVEAQVDQG
jgi:hypothetical protein